MLAVVYYGDVPVWRRVASIVLGFTLSCLSSGVIFGYGALKTVLLDAGVYRQLCVPADSTDINDVHGCKEQIARLDLMYTIAVSVLNLSFFCVGVVMDRFGTRVACLSGAVVYSLGLIGFGVAYSADIDLYLVSFTLLAIGGPFIFMSTLNTSVSFPRYSSAIMSLLSCSVDVSSAVFLVFNVLYSGNHVRVDTFFFLYLTVPVLSILYALFILPSSTLVAVRPVVADEIKGDDVSRELAARLAAGRPAVDKALHVDTVADIESPCIVYDDDPEVAADGVADGHDFPVEGADSPLISGCETSSRLGNSRRSMRPSSRALERLPLRDKMLSPEYILLVVFMCIYMLRVNFFIGSFGNQLKLFPATKSTRDDVERVFGLLLPIGPLVSVPLSSYALTKLPPYIIFSALTLVYALFGATILTSNLGLLYTGVVLFVLSKSVIYAAASSFVASTFGFATFGRMYGTTMLISGIFSFIQQGLFQLIADVWNGEYWQVNVILACVCLVTGTVFSVFLFTRRPRHFIG